MKNVIIMVSILSAAIITAVLIMSSANEQTRKEQEPEKLYTQPPVPEFELRIETTTMKFWDKVAALNSTAVSEPDAQDGKDIIVVVTDEDGNIVTDENGNAVTEIMHYAAPAEVTSVPDDIMQNNLPETAVPGE